MINLHLQCTHGSIKHWRRVRWQMARLLPPAISVCVDYGCQKGLNPFTFVSYQLAAACPKHRSKLATQCASFMAPQRSCGFCVCRYFSITFSQFSLTRPEVTSISLMHVASRGRCGVFDWRADASPYLAWTAKYLWCFVTSHTDSFGRKFLFVLPLRLTTSSCPKPYRVCICVRPLMFHLKACSN